MKTLKEIQAEEPDFQPMLKPLDQISKEAKEFFDDLRMNGRVCCSGFDGNNERILSLKSKVEVKDIIITYPPIENKYFTEPIF